MNNFPNWDNGTFEYAPVDKKELIEKMRRAMELIVFMPPNLPVFVRVSCNLINLEVCVRELLK